MTLRALIQYAESELCLYASYGLKWLMLIPITSNIPILMLLFIFISGVNSFFWCLMHLSATREGTDETGHLSGSLVRAFPACIHTKRMTSHFILYGP